MKYRVGFVTNSSSSSYIVAHKLVKVDKLEGLPEPVKTAYNYIFDSYFYDTVSELKGVKEFISNVYGYDNFEEALEDDKEFISSVYELMKEKIEEGFSISEFVYNYGDEVGPGIILELEKKGYATIIKGI